MFSQPKARELRDPVLLEPSQIVVRPGARHARDARNEGARRQHQSRVRSEICRDFNSRSARADPYGSAFPIGGEKHPRRRKNMREQMAEPLRVPHRRSMLALKRKIVMRAEPLKARPAFVPP